ncbi:hypothetical protein CMK18_20860 [Candidatus Poribacteria bacterium]|nr:hypothetical protein [Candidatus Poribacteria bacterium]
MKIVRYSEDDFSSICSIFARIYVRNPLLRNVEYFKWQFLRQPYNYEGLYTLWLLKEDDLICGFYGWVPVKINANGKMKNGCEPLIWWVNAKHKFHGLQLLNRIRNENEICLYQNCSEESQKIFRKMKFSVFSLPRCVTILNRKKAKEVFHNYDITQIRDFERGDKVFDLFVVDRFTQAENSSLQKYQNIHFHLCYTTEYLNWRYVDIPFHSYKIIKNESVGWIVYRLEKIIGSDTYILKIMEVNICQGKIGVFLQSLIRHLNNEKIIMVDFFCSAQELLDEFATVGFEIIKQHTGTQIPKWYRPINRSRDLVSSIDMLKMNSVRWSQPSSWYITLGNSDIDREWD